LRIFEVPKSKRANVVLFHGLGGDALTTWGAAKDDKNDEHFWPRWLEEDVEGLSVYSVHYEADPLGWHASAMAGERGAHPRKCACAVLSRTRWKRGSSRYAARWVSLG